MESLVIRDIIPGTASEDTLTPGRKFLQVVFKFAAEEGFLTTKRITSRNFWDSYLGGQREDGAELNINADQLFLSICEHLGITSENIKTIKWEPGTDRFQKVIGMRVKGDLVSHYVEGYTIPNSLSKLSTRYTYSAIVLEGEDENSVFRAQGHVIVRDPERVAEIKRRLEEISSVNEEAREDRQKERGVATQGERTGTGAIVGERSLSGKTDDPDSLLEQARKSAKSKAKPDHKLAP